MFRSDGCTGRSPDFRLSSTNEAQLSHGKWNSTPYSVSLTLNVLSKTACDSSICGDCCATYLPMSTCALEGCHSLPSRVGFCCNWQPYSVGTLVLHRLRFSSQPQFLLYSTPRSMRYTRQCIRSTATSWPLLQTT